MPFLVLGIAMSKAQEVPGQMALEDLLHDSDCGPSPWTLAYIAFPFSINSLSAHKSPGPPGPSLSHCLY